MYFLALKLVYNLKYLVASGLVHLLTLDLVVALNLVYFLVWDVLYFASLNLVHVSVFDPEYLIQKPSFLFDMVDSGTLLRTGSNKFFSFESGICSPMDTDRWQISLHTIWNISLLWLWNIPWICCRCISQESKPFWILAVHCKTIKH